MRILVNLLPASTGGALQNAANIWRAVAEWGDGDEWLCVSRPGPGSEDSTTSPWQQIEVMEPGRLPERLWVDNYAIPQLARRWNADVVFTPMGAGPVRAPVPTVVGWHDATAAYPKSILWKRLSHSQRFVFKARERYARLAVRRAGRVCVQTRAMKTRLAARWKIDPARFAIVPNGPSAFLSGEAPAPSRPQARRPWKVLVIGDPKPSKNWAVLPETGARLAEMGIGDGRFVMTISSDNDGPWLEEFRATLARWGERVPIERLGWVPHAALGPLYRDADAVFLPSVLESFSASYVEAMQFGVPLVTSRMDFARDVCGAAAEYADPFDGKDCARALARVLCDPARRAALRRAGFERIRRFPDWKERLRLYRRACAASAGELS